MRSPMQNSDDARRRLLPQVERSAKLSMIGSPRKGADRVWEASQRMGRSKRTMSLPSAKRRGSAFQAWP